MARTKPTAIERTLIQPGEGQTANFVGLRVARKIEGLDTDGRFAVVEHTIQASCLAVPLHRHHSEDEYSYVIEGTFGAIVGEEVLFATPGSWVIKPRGEWRASWNAGVSVCRVLDVISPAGFENYFREVAAVVDAAVGKKTPDLERLAAVNERYRVDMDFDSIPDLCYRFGLTHPMA